MNAVSSQLSRKPLNHLRLLFTFHKWKQLYYVPINTTSVCCSTAVEAMDAFTVEILQRQRNRRKSLFDINSFSLRYCMHLDEKKTDVSMMTTQELDAEILKLMSKNKDKEAVEIIHDCIKFRKNMSEITVKKLYRHYSGAGKPDIIEILQKFTSTVNLKMHKRNGEFLHYLAKAQCMRGNSAKGLTILIDCYTKYEGLRNFYRIIFRELIQDSVLNRSEASLVIFKKHVLEFSEKWSEHYPLICFWHMCWSSSWFSDQMLSNELLESSAALQNIVKDRATDFSITILRQELNEDAVFRLLQVLLKYNMMDEYVKVLQILFGYKLKNRDMKGCREIIRNCEVLGVSLTPVQQGRYIKMLIDGQRPDIPQSDKKTASKSFKLKF